MQINNIFSYLLFFFAAVNLIAFLIMMFDKNKSSSPGARRISEGMMFFLASAFGSIGVYWGMFAFRHKTQKWYFVCGIPLLILENAATIYCIYLIMQNKLIL